MCHNRGNCSLPPLLMSPAAMDLAAVAPLTPALTITPSCSCELPYAPPNCSTVACDAALCVNGRCTDDPVPGRSACICSRGWHGVKCDEPVCSPRCMHGSCASPFQCACEEHWAGPACATFQSPVLLGRMGRWTEAHAHEVFAVLCAAGIALVSCLSLYANMWARRPSLALDAKLGRGMGGDGGGLSGARAGAGAGGGAGSGRRKKVRFSSVVYNIPNPPLVLSDNDDDGQGDAAVGGLSHPFGAPSAGFPQFQRPPMVYADSDGSYTDAFSSMDSVSQLHARAGAGSGHGHLPPVSGSPAHSSWFSSGRRYGRRSAGTPAAAASRRGPSSSGATPRGPRPSSGDGVPPRNRRSQDAGSGGGGGVGGSGGGRGGAAVDSGPSTSSVPLPIPTRPGRRAVDTDTGFRPGSSGASPSSFVVLSASQTGARAAAAPPATRDRSHSK